MKRLILLALAYLALAVALPGGRLWAEDLSLRSPAVKNHVKSFVRNRVVRDGDLERFCLRCDANWKDCDDCNLVVLVHGFNSTARVNGSLLHPIREAGFACALFDYPNDHSLDTSSRLLAEELARLAKECPKRQISIVAHSMGSLVARACIENDELDPGNVSQLIMIAPPTHGSLLAKMALGTDLYEHGKKFGRGGLRESIIDGLGEAADDLKPGSAFLRQLNARERHSDVDYTVVLGTGGNMKSWELYATRKMVGLSAKRIPFVRKRKSRIDEVLKDLDEVVAGKGDGAVAVKRGRLAGVEDTLILPFHHITVTGPPDTREVSRVHDVVLNRLKRHARR